MTAEQKTHKKQCKCTTDATEADSFFSNIAGNVLKYKKGQVLFYQGHLPWGLFRLVKGAVALQTKKSRKTKQTIITPNHLLGLRHFLTETPFCSTAVALDELVVNFLPKAAILTQVGPTTLKWLKSKVRGPRGKTEDRRLHDKKI